MVTWFGIINAAILIITLITAEVMRRRSEALDPRHMTRLLAGLSAIISAGLVVFGLARSFPLALASYSAVSIARSTLNPLFSSWTNRGIPSTVRATVLSTFGQMDAVGQVIGGPLIGVIANQLGLRAALAAAGFLLTPVLLLYQHAYRQRPAAAETESAGA
jgi:DHA3 family tetracycline resistance protein-like MFS transporter